MHYLSLFKATFSTVLIIIFNHINFINCKFSTGGFGFTSYFIGNKLYFLEFTDVGFYYVDLTGELLDDITFIDKPKLVDLSNIKPQPNMSESGAISLLGGKANDQIMIFDKIFPNDITTTNTLTPIVNSFDTIQNQWILN